MRVAPNTPVGTPSQSRPLSHTSSLSPPVDTHALLVRLPRESARAAAVVAKLGWGLRESEARGRAVPSRWHRARRGPAGSQLGDPAPWRGPSLPRPRPRRRPRPILAARGARPPEGRTAPARTQRAAHLGGAGPVAPIPPPRRLRISWTPTRRPPGRLAVPAGRKRGSWGRAEATSSGPRSRHLLPPAPAPPAARSRAGNLSGRVPPPPALALGLGLRGGGGGPALRGAGATPGVRRGECTPGARPAWGRGPAQQRWPEALATPRRPGRPFTQAAAPSGETLARPPLHRPRRTWRVSRCDRHSYRQERPFLPSLDPGRQELVWLGTSFPSCSPDRGAHAGHPVPLLVRRRRESHEISLACALSVKGIRMPTWWMPKGLNCHQGNI